MSERSEQFLERAEMYAQHFDAMKAAARETVEAQRVEAMAVSAVKARTDELSKFVGANVSNRSAQTSNFTTTAAN